MLCFFAKSDNSFSASEYKTPPPDIIIGCVDFLIDIEPGKDFSVFALEPCESVTLKGGRWSIEDEFFSLSTRGLHNVSESSLLRVSTDGNLIVVVHR